MPRRGERSNKVGPSVTRNEHSSQAEDCDGITLHECVRNDSIAKLEKLLKTKKCLRHVNDPDDSSLTPLHYAAKVHNLKACELLLTVGKANAVVRDEEGALPLHYACRKIPTNEEQATKVIELLLSRCPRLDRCLDDYGSTPLHIAAIRGNITAVNTLLKNYKTQPVTDEGKVDASVKEIVDVRDRHQCTPLHEAATYNQTAVAKLLIENGCSIYVRDNDGCTPLHLACAEGSLEMVRVLLDNCKGRTVKQLINQGDADDTTALQYAVKARNFELVTELTKRGAKVDNKRSDKVGGGTTLHLAAITGDKNIVEYLLIKNDDVNATDSRHYTALHLAAQYNSLAVADTLVQCPHIEMDKPNVDGLTPLLIAAVHGSGDVLTMLLRRRANVTATDKSEQGILHLAVRHERENSIRIVQQHFGSEDRILRTLVNGMDKFGLTPLHLASQSGNLVIVKMLLELGANAFVKDETEETPFLQAAERGHVHIMNELKSHNEKVINDEDEFSNTCLHKAAENGHLKAVKALTAWGVSKDARNNKYWSPLNMAVVNGHDEVVSFFLDEKTSPNSVDKNENTTLHMAAKYGHPKVIEKLILGGADVTALDKSKRNCLDVAIANGHKNAALAILKSNAWYKALANDRPYKDGKKPRNTPLRQLVCEMPDVASVALSRCVNHGKDETGEYIDFNFDFIDDSYINYSALKAGDRAELLSDEENNQEYYTSDKNWLKKNHLLSLLLNSAQSEELARHPLVLALIRHKWKAIRPLYYVFLAFYACFVAMVTGYMLALRPPYEQVQIMPNDTMKSWCAKLETEVGCPSEDDDRFYAIATYLIWCMCFIGATVEIIQLSSQGILYFRLLNLLDWYTYVSAVLITLNEAGQMQCGIKKCWQWQMAAFTIFCCWCDLLLFTRRLPALGIYIVMVVEILTTFVKFFVVFFLFVVAFAMSFHLLIQNQAPFSTPFYAISKTWVMMLGEMDYGTIFHEEFQPFESTMFALFWMFLVLMAIIVMNLLTGLAVDDVNLLRHKARIVRLRLQVDLALDIELAMPRFLRKWSKTTVRRDRIYFDERSMALSKLIENIEMVLEDSLLTKSSVIDAENNLVQHDGGQRLGTIDMEARINERLHNIERRINDILLSRDESRRSAHCSCCRRVTEKKTRKPTNLSTVKSGSAVGRSSGMKSPGIEEGQEAREVDKTARILLGDTLMKIQLDRPFSTSRHKKEDRIHLMSSEEEETSVA